MWGKPRHNGSAPRLSCSYSVFPFLLPLFVISLLGCTSTLLQQATLIPSHTPLPTQKPPTSTPSSTNTPIPTNTLIPTVTITPEQLSLLDSMLSIIWLEDHKYQFDQSGVILRYQFTN